eukprot:3042822-Alexandrium_andersonii.AAC.1
MRGLCEAQSEWAPDGHLGFEKLRSGVAQTSSWPPEPPSADSFHARYHLYPGSRSFPRGGLHLQRGSRSYCFAPFAGPG